MKQRISRLIEPKQTLPKERQIFTNLDLRKLIIPLFWEQLLEVFVGVADTFMVSHAGEAAVSGVSLVNMFNTVFSFYVSGLGSAVNREKIKTGCPFVWKIRLTDSKYTI